MSGGRHESEGQAFGLEPEFADGGRLPQLVLEQRADGVDARVGSTGGVDDRAVVGGVD